MKFARPLLISFSLLAFASATAYAQQQSGQGTPSPQSQEQSASAGASQKSQSEMPVGELIGMKVTDSQGKDLGEITEVVIDLQSGKAHAAVLEFGGFMGIGDKQFAFPMSELKPGKDKNKLTVNVDKQKLENAEGFAKGQMPGMDADYWSRVGGQAGQASAGGGGQQGQKMNLVKASDMKGKEVQDKSGQQVGEIQDIMVDISDGTLKNIVIDVKDAGKATVQASSLSSGTDDKLVIDMTQDQLKSQAKQSQGASTGGASGSK